MRRGRALAAAVAVAAASGLAATADAAGLTPALQRIAGGVLPPPPPLPVSTAKPVGAQPTLPMRPCTFTPPGPGEMRPLIHRRFLTKEVTTEGYPAATVDATDPCHILEVSTHHAERSDDSGATSATIFDVAAETAPSSDPHLAAALMPRAGDQWLVDTNGGYGIVESSDGGEHWTQRSGGLPVVDGSSSIASLTFAPSNAEVAYTVVTVRPSLVGVTLTTLYTTHDGGGTWQLLPLQAAAITAVAVDPVDDQRVVVTDAGHSGISAPAMWESTDGGQSWATRPLPASAGIPVAVLLTHPGSPSSAAPRMYVETSQNGSALWWQSRDDGVTWRYLPVPEQYPGLPGGREAPVLVADPNHPDSMVFAALIDPQIPDSLSSGTRLTFVSSSDGFVTARATTRFDPPEFGRHVTGFSGIGNLRLMADRRGDFFLGFDIGTADGNWAELYAFRLQTLDHPLHVAPPLAMPPLPDPAGLPVTKELRDCPLQTPSGLSYQLNHLQQGTSSNSASGTLVFDGQYLDYTHDGYTPNLIDRVDPVTCQAAPPLALAIPPDASGNPQPLRQLTYDSRYTFASGDRGAILAVGVSDATTHDNDTIPVYAIDPLTGAAELALHLPPEAYAYYDWPGKADTSCHAPGCQVFTYDVFTDMLWVELGGDIGRVRMPAVHGAVATPVDTCMDHILVFGKDDGGFGSATVLVGADGIMYSQQEDDQTILRADDRTCRVLDGFRHTAFTEGQDENDQLACDPLTFGQGSDYAAGGHAPTSVMWIRDANLYVVRAYAIVDGVCPFPTRLTLRAMPATLVGSPAPLCAVLRRESASHPPIGGAAVSFSIDGRPVASGRTDPAGGVCVTATAPGPPGVHAVRADFAGTPVYLPSHDEGPLPTYALAVPPAWRQLLPPLLPPGSTEPIPVQQPTVQSAAQPEGQLQLQAQAQAQSQVNSQTASQMQPGMMVQRQPQRQVATQGVSLRGTSPAYNAVRVRERRPTAPLAAVTAAALLLGLATLRRRPAMARAGRPFRTADRCTPAPARLRPHRR